MSLADSPAHSSSSDDFAAILDAELDTLSDASADSKEVGEEEQKYAFADEDNFDLDLQRVKRRKVELSEDVTNPQSSSSQGEMAEVSGSSNEKNKCPHPGHIGGMCVRCGQKIDDVSGVAFGVNIMRNDDYLIIALPFDCADLRLSNDEMARVRGRDLKNLLRNKKLYLVLDLDHTLLNSARFSDITLEEGYLNSQGDTFPDALKSSLFRLNWMHMMTKLRPFVHKFLNEASNLFEMYIYTMGERPYALEMARLLDPRNIYFSSRIIAQGDCTQRFQKGLDVVLGQESAVIILDDTEAVWAKHKENLILMERYHFFASSCKHFGFNCKSLSELKSDESETEGALATILKILQRVHGLFFDEKSKDDLEDRDVRQVLKSVRNEVLRGCKVVFSRVFPTNFPAEHHSLWKMAEQLGATCSIEVDPSVTHVVSVDAGTDKSRWAVKEKKHLVHPRWIEASNYMWQKQPEEKFPVSQAKNK
ncbi:RNA polymerase II ctd phosphatase [Striga asiatica]|uniref:RNA polymerase II C-terminal domain phosphatase-like n=1 Tax=Striga asiatica TaxID=4170 RepID=A0A5A7QXR6_STRAF|nr:RNA polymerase II ctd phosphatase [Striga asiatica]